MPSLQAPNAKATGEDNPRIFTRAMKDECWKRAPLVPGRDPDRWRMDASGNPVIYILRGCDGCLCHEYDHIKPYSIGGKTTVENCQILQTRVNRLKGADPDDPIKQRSYSCARRFDQDQTMMDIIEMALYGGVKREGLVCKCKSIFELSKSLSTQKDSNIIPSLVNGATAAANIHDTTPPLISRRKPQLPDCPI